jgi:hypothetical protein
MKLLEIIIEILDVIIEKVPIIGSFKKRYEEGFRRLSEKEVISFKWTNAIADFLNDKFQIQRKRNLYKGSQIEDWLKTYPDAFIVFVKRKLFSRKNKRERIILMAKFLPLKEDTIKTLRDSFDPYNIKGEDLVNNHRKAKAFWIGDLISTNNSLPIIVSILKSKVEYLNLPVYCRTGNEKLRRILFERYGAKVLNPTGEEVTDKTILVFFSAMRSKNNK